MAKPNPVQFFLVKFAGPYRSQAEAENAYFQGELADEPEPNAETCVIKAQAFEVLVAFHQKTVTQNGGDLAEAANGVEKDRWHGKIESEEFTVTRRTLRIIRDEDDLDGMYNSVISEDRNDQVS